MSIAKKPILLLIVTQSDLGGAQRYVLSIAQAARERFCVIIAAGPDGGGALLREASSSGLETLLLANLGREIRPWRDVRALFEFRRRMHEIRPDIVHANSTKAGVLTSLARVKNTQKTKYVYTAHGWIFLEPMPRLQRFAYRVIERFAGRSRDATIVLSPVEADTAMRAGIASSDKLSLIPNGVSLRPHDRIRARMELERAGVPGGATVIVSVANFYPTKNLPSLVRAFRAAAKNDPLLHLVLIGDGTERPLVEAAGQDDARVHLLGYRSDARDLLDGCDLFVLPSSKEGLPFALLEAMEASLPCLATNVGGIPAIIKNNLNGWLVKPDDLAAGLRRALSLRDHWQRIGNAARGSVLASFTEEKMVSRTLALYERLLQA